MNIGRLLQNMIGNPHWSDMKITELKVGQIVKGMVLQMLTDNEALVNIGGAQVMAKLETPLRQGQATMLQVQPESRDGLIVLKPLNASRVPIAEQSVKDLLQQYGMKDQPRPRQLMQQMHIEGIPLTKENVKLLHRSVNFLPDDVPADQAAKAAVTALQRGLPATEATMRSLHEVLHGKPLHKVLELAVVLFTRIAAGQEEPEWTSRYPQMRELAGQLSGKIRHIQQAGGQIADPYTSTDAGTDSGTARDRMPGNGTAIDIRPVSRGNSSARHRSSLEQSVQPQPQLSDKQEIIRTTPGSGSDPVESTVHKPSGTEASARITGTENTMIGRLFQWMGLDHERLLSKWDAPAVLQSLGESSDIVGPLSRPAVFDSLKGLLLQLNQIEELPITVKEAAQQLLHQITGQQLLMLPDRLSPFTEITLFLPIKNPNGEQTAAVHIQSRKNKRGEIDAQNCRVLFDLHMKTLGNMILDVQVTDRIVSLYAHNDHPALPVLLEANRTALAAALKNMGYQFISFKCSPFPKVEADGEELTNAKTALNGSSAKLGPGNSYKRVDIRI
jgi:hypothetical protein